MSRHRAAEPRRWVAHACAATVTAAGIACVVVFGAWSSSGPILPVLARTPTSTPAPSSTSCIPTSWTTEAGRTWHGCWPTFASARNAPRPTTRPTPSSTTEATPGPAVLPTVDPFAEE